MHAAVGRAAWFALVLGACTQEILPPPAAGGEIGAEIPGGWDDLFKDGPRVETTPGQETGPAPDLGPKAGEFGYPCDSGNDCYSGHCVDSPDGKVCTTTCDDEPCPAGWSCEQLSSGGDTSYICLSADTYLCLPCHTDADCNHPGVPAAGFCVDTKEGAFCSRNCADSPCPSGYACLTTEEGGGEPVLTLCAPADDGPCTCTARFVAQQASTSCLRENELGACEGDAVCQVVGEVPECLAKDPVAETCNQVDDDCDGDADEDATDCTTYFLDSDGDLYGLGSVGTCTCQKPADGNWITAGGDCNELVTAVNPGAPEACNGLDDDCDGVTDEPDAKGCKAHYLDGDGDQFGLEGASQCLCGGTPGYAPGDGDCDDLNPLVNPQAEEACDGQDNDCNGQTDEEDADGCKPYFLDQDGDNFGLTEKVKCLCGPTGVYLAVKPGDCNDKSDEVSPQALEICNGVDDNCNGKTDEGAGNSMCPEIAHGTAGCVTYALASSPCGLGACCGLTGCDDGWSDADDDPQNGCECAAGSLEAVGAPGQTCQDPTALGILMDNGSEAEVTDNIVPADDSDWFQFDALDGADPGGCDTWKLRIFFVHNPQDQFAFDVYKGGCAGSQQLAGCDEVTEMTDTTSFYDAGGGGKPKGECPCVAVADDGGTAPGVQKCSDQSASYSVRVYRKPGHPESCAAYTLRVTNGK